MSTDPVPNGSEASPTLIAALDYAARGWKVIQLRPVEKYPIRARPAGYVPEDGSSYLNSSDPETLRQWWRERPDGAVGIETGRVSGFWVLDVDGDDGMKALADLEAKHGPLPHTVSSRSGSGNGQHYLFRSPGFKIKTRPKWHGVPIDTRGDGGQFVAPPSQHKSGRQYEWIIRPDQAEIAEAPQWLLDWLSTPSVPAPPAYSGPPIVVDVVAQQARRYLAAIPGAVSGCGGHNATFRAACVLVLDFALSPDDAYPLLAEWNQTCKPQWTDAELQHKLSEADKQPGPRGSKIQGQPNERSQMAYGRARRPQAARRIVGEQIRVAHDSLHQGERPAPVPLAGVLPRAPDQGDVGCPAPVPFAQVLPPAPDRRDVGFRFAPLTSAEFAIGDYRPSWLIQNLLVRGQPAVIGGPKKAMKTSLLVDLAFSLATAAPFLGRFEVPTRRRVTLISGESGHHTLQETALRIAARKRIDFAAAGVHWLFDLPSFTNPEHIDELARGLAVYRTEVLIVDPLYLAMLGCGGSGLNATNLFDIGPLLRRVAKAVQDQGATLILAHHATKPAGRTNGPIELEDLAFSGIQEFARQWLLVNRREKYVPGTGQHRLWLSAGGSMGHGGLWGVDVDEGVLDDDFRGRGWDITVRTASELIAAERACKQQASDCERRSEELSDDQKVISVLVASDPQRSGVAKTDLKAATMLSPGRLGAALLRLAGQIEPCSVIKITGNGARSRCGGFRLRAEQ